MACFWKQDLQPARHEGNYDLLLENLDLQPAGHEGNDDVTVTDVLPLAVKMSALAVDCNYGILGRYEEVLGKVTAARSDDVLSAPLEIFRIDSCVSQT